MLKNHPVLRWGVLSLFLSGAISVCVPALGQAPPAAAPPQGTVSDTLKAAVDAFNQGDFQTAATSLEAVLQNAVTEGATVTSVNIMVFDYYIAKEGVVNRARRQSTRPTTPTLSCRPSTRA